MPIRRKLRWALEYALVRASGVVLRLMPMWMAVELVSRLCGLIAPRTSLHRRACANIAAALPELSLAERNRIIAEMWRNTGRVVAETMLLGRLLPTLKSSEINGREALTASVAIPGPQLGVTLHLGNWELCAWASAECGWPMAGVYRPLRNPYLDNWLHERRKPLYPGGLLFKGNRAGTEQPGRQFLAAINFLRQGGYMGFVADQADHMSPFTVPFFNHNARFTPAPAIFARRLKARPWIGRCVRLGRASKFRFDVIELTFEPSSDMDADIRRLTAAMAAQFEAWIRETPEQWMWWQRRSIGDPIAIDGAALDQNAARDMARTPS